MDTLLLYIDNADTCVVFFALLNLITTSPCPQQVGSSQLIPLSRLPQLSLFVDDGAGDEDENGAGDKGGDGSVDGASDEGNDDAEDG